VSYALFFGSLLLVMFLVWLPMPSERPSAPMRAYRNAFLISGGLTSALGLLAALNHWAPPSVALFAIAGALLGGFVATLIDTGFVQKVVPFAATGDGDVPAGQNADGHSIPKPWTQPFRAAGSLIGLAVTLPVWPVIAVLIWLDEPGPILLAKESVRGDGVALRRLRFRCTKYEAEPVSADPGLSSAGEPPILGVGALLRGSRLERLPELVTVLVLAMSPLRPLWLGIRRRVLPRGGQVGMPRRPRRRIALATVAAACAVLTTAVVVTAVRRPDPKSQRPPAAAARLAVPQAFDPGENAVLPHRRVVAFYGIPGAPQTGPAHVLDDSVLERLREQGAEYERLDPAHPVALGIDLVASVPDSFPGDDGLYRHRVDTATLERYVEFCRANNLLLFLDLSFGWSPPLKELEYFMPYLTLPFVHLAIDPEWMFPRHDGVPGINLSNARADDLNPLITAMGDLAVQHRIPRKIVILHQFRPTGDGLTNPRDPGAAEIADKGNIVNDSRVDVVWHVDSVGGWPGDIQEKTRQYGSWVRKDMARFRNFQYGGFKIFYQIESKSRLMTPAEVMKLKPPPMVVTYGN
jgi:hypothetical protein